MPSLALPVELDVVEAQDGAGGAGDVDGRAAGRGDVGGAGGGDGDAVPALLSANAAPSRRRRQGEVADAVP